MGCASSKSTPTVDTNPANNDNLGQTLLNNGKAMAMKSQEDIMNKVDDLKHDIMDTLSIGSRRKEDCDEDDMTESRQEPSSPPTERVHDEDNDMQITDVNEISDETNEAMNTGERTIPITMTLDMEQTENSAEPSEKPPTPMPESVKMNAQWPFLNSELNESPPKISEEVARATPLDTIAEEKRFVNIPASESAGAAVVEILTIEIAEIPIEDNTNSMNDENQSDEEKKEEEKEN